MKIAIIAGTAVIASFVGTLFSMVVARKLAIFDTPAKLKIHTIPVPRLGGLGILVGFFVGAGLLGLLNSALLIGGTAIWLVGFLDDRYNLTPAQKLLGQGVAALFTAIIVFLSEAGSQALVIAGLCFILIVTYANAINLLDGMNGLAAGNAAISFVGVAIIEGTHHAAILGAVAAAATLGFLPWNFPRARTFMGDSGSLLLGFLVAYMLTRLFVESVELFVCGLVVSVLPLLDMCLGIVRRALSGRHIFEADRGHFYDAIDFRIQNKSRTVFLTYALSICLALLGIMVSFNPLWVACMTLGLVVLSFAAFSIKLGWLRCEV